MHDVVSFEFWVLSFEVSSSSVSCELLWPTTNNLLRFWRHPVIPSPSPRTFFLNLTLQRFRSCRHCRRTCKILDLHLDTGKSITRTYTHTSHYIHTNWHVTHTHTHTHIHSTRTMVFYLTSTHLPPRPFATKTFFFFKAKIKHCFWLCFAATISHSRLRRKDVATGTQANKLPAEWRRRDEPTKGGAMQTHIACLNDGNGVQLNSCKRFCNNKMLGRLLSIISLERR